MNIRPFRADIHPERNEGYCSNNIQQNPAFEKFKSGARNLFFKDLIGTKQNLRF